MNREILNQRVEILVRDCKWLIKRLERQGSRVRERPGLELDHILARAREAIARARERLQEWRLVDLGGFSGGWSRMERSVRGLLRELGEFPIQNYEDLDEAKILDEVEQLETLLALARVRVRERRGSARSSILTAVAQAMERLEGLGAKGSASQRLAAAKSR